MARHGFDVQDHVVAGFLIDLLQDASLLQVWCETHDDITLIWAASPAERVEFVQVKSHALDQLWSVARLCARERSSANETGSGTSILERSLAQDRCSEPCAFRIVTCRPVQDDLTVLTYPLSSPHRNSIPDPLNDLANDIERRAGALNSPNGNGISSWLRRTLWEERHSLESVSNDNLRRLKLAVEGQGGYIFNDQLEDLYSAFLTRARNAAVADWRVDPRAKKITKAEWSAWFQEDLARRLHQIPATGGTKLRQKLQIAGIAPDCIETSAEHRLLYLTERLKPQYLKIEDRQLVEGEVSATLHGLRSRLDAGEIQDSGIEFHARCLRSLDELRGNLQVNPLPPLAFMYGCMYSITDRCLHRFRRVTV